MKRVNIVLASFLNQLFLNSRDSGFVCRSGVRTTTMTMYDEQNRRTTDMKTDNEMKT